MMKLDFVNSVMKIHVNMPVSGKGKLNIEFFDFIKIMFFSFVSVEHFNGFFLIYHRYPQLSGFFVFTR